MVEQQTFNLCVAGSNPVGLVKNKNRFKLKVETKNILIPKYRKLNSDEVKTLLNTCNISSTSKLPKIKMSDKSLDFETTAGDVLEIERNFSFCGKTKYWRVVVE